MEEKEILESVEETVSEEKQVLTEEVFEEVAKEELPLQEASSEESTTEAEEEAAELVEEAEKEEPLKTEAESEPSETEVKSEPKVEEIDEESEEMAAFRASFAKFKKGKLAAFKKEILSLIDHTNLKQGLTTFELKTLCEEAHKNGFCSVCVHPVHVAEVRKILRSMRSAVKVCTVIGFPLGENTTAVKVFETKKAIKDGAQEIDMVISNSMVRRGQFKNITKEVRAVRRACGGAILKVIIETSILNNSEIESVCKALLKTNADFVKTSTGFVGGGATVEAVSFIKSVVKDKMQIKASGGIANLKSLVEMHEAGAMRIGTSKGAKIAAEISEISVDKK